MGEPAVIDVRIPYPVRRFEIADLSEHGPWIMARFKSKFPEYSDREVAGYLSRLVYDNEHMFLYQPDAVGLAQIVHAPAIRMVKLVQERFVWIKDRTNKDQQEAAADIYLKFHSWAKGQEAKRLIVCEDSDVPKNLIEARLGRLLDSKITHARV